jgi:hypothetical protein
MQLILLSASAGFLIGILFYPEDGSDVSPKRRAFYEEYGFIVHKILIFLV